MKVCFIRSGDRRYGIQIERASDPTLVMDPAPGFDRDLPHDMVHFVVEAALGLKGGVFGQIAAGGDAGSFRVNDVSGGPAREHRRVTRKQVSKGRKLVDNQGRDGELSELAAFLFDIAWRSRSRPDSAAQKIALGEAERTRQSLSADEKRRIDAARPEVFERFDALSLAWRGLKVGDRLALEWPTLRLIDRSDQ